MSPFDYEAKNLEDDKTLLDTNNKDVKELEKRYLVKSNHILQFLLSYKEF
jgi:hypothetical protein